MKQITQAALWDCIMSQRADGTECIQDPEASGGPGTKTISRLILIAGIVERSLEFRESVSAIAGGCGPRQRPSIPAAVINLCVTNVSLAALMTRDGTPSALAGPETGEAGALEVGWEFAGNLVQANWPGLKMGGHARGHIRWTLVHSGSRTERSTESVFAIDSNVTAKPGENGGGPCVGARDKDLYLFVCLFVCRDAGRHSDSRTGTG
ncbi:uncharacterized protein BJ171DRAFT_303439 [Polychytrium aggregatum]|uniref:uncharacterized protein n=1 Tax=Polychytrium aggregatum TaxID=110093 RepID=UPI0022FE6468|nr:uncharacterized protein BJ171DRAFT_303439 [Polychytrium aggregatum]KAI9193132.1 hypothetical protein BJ171DRAFT_303439 [Polychytrium aggregatum]